MYDRLFYNKIKPFQAEEKVTPSQQISVTYSECILDMALCNITGRHFLNLFILRGKMRVLDSEEYHLDMLVIHLFTRKETYFRIVTDNQ